ncbi:MAG: hypothetical protein KC478_09365, partial [Bacteriovoracaceae bacterium]|nr:hypothetical protein [Bacteriovoracaceae bacterium]
MTRYALIGKNIQHSKSPEVYKQILGHEVDYTFLDYSCDSEIPPLKDLLGEYERISITSPYKQYIVENADRASSEATELQAANAIKLEGASVVATNTDAQAFADIYSQTWPGFHPIILGDGAMSRLAQNYFRSNKISFDVLSRKLKNLGEIDEHINKVNGSALIINSCAREYQMSFNSTKS